MTKHVEETRVEGGCHQDVAPDQPDCGAQAQETSRRGFLWDAVKTFTFGAMTLTAIPMLVSAAQANEGEAAGQGNKDGAGKDADPPLKAVLYGFLVDTTRCIGCSGCMVACSHENSVPSGQFRTWVERYVYFKDGQVQVDMNTAPPFAFSDLPPIDASKVDKAFFVPKLCNHCVSTPCIQVCPVGASFIAPDGIVLVDGEHCIGCAYCVQACPFGSRFINRETQVADKCTWCYHRVHKGLRPACVEVCPTNARIFGNLSDRNSEISQRMAAHRIDVLKSYLGTRPKTRYIGLTAEVV